MEHAKNSSHDQVQTNEHGDHVLFYASGASEVPYAHDCTFPMYALVPLPSWQPCAPPPAAAAGGPQLEEQHQVACVQEQTHDAWHTQQTAGLLPAELVHYISQPCEQPSPPAAASGQAAPQQQKQQQKQAARTLREQRYGLGEDSHMRYFYITRADQQLILHTLENARESQFRLLQSQGEQTRSLLKRHAQDGMREISLAKRHCSNEFGETMGTTSTMPTHVLSEAQLPRPHIVATEATSTTGKSKVLNDMECQRRERRRMIWKSLPGSSLPASSSSARPQSTGHTESQQLCAYEIACMICERDDTRRDEVAAASQLLSMPQCATSAPADSSLQRMSLQQSTSSDAICYRNFSPLSME